MNISLNWLKKYVDIDLPVKELCEILTDLGLEVGNVEEYVSVKGAMQGLVIGEVKTCAKHPNADKLSVTTVDVGGENLLPIVCGAPNVAAGQKVVVATVGTTLYMGDDELKIKKSKIRGEVSEGMICAEDEIGIGDDHDGIIELDASAEVGSKAADYFGIYCDTIIEIDLTPNRVDGASHIGVARDLVAYLKQNGRAELKMPAVDDFKVDNTNNPVEVVVENTEACRRYAGITVSGIEVKESPEWLQNSLKAIGQKPINNIVDITNYVLHELGQPLHAFDMKKINKKKVVVKTLASGTKFTTLDEAERELNEKDLMICNTEEGMCIAGVFGGIDSGVKEGTTDVFIESAYFDPVYVRKTAKRHALNTDASFRFERGIDPNITIYALKRAAMLIKEVAGGEISSEIVDIYPNPIEDFKIEVSYANINRLIGKKLGTEKIKNILTALDIKISGETHEGLSLEVPPYRVDVKREADIIEEILRVYGYNNVEVSTDVKSTIQYAPKPDTNKIRNKVSDMLSSNGFNEAMSNSLTKSAYYEGLESYNAENTVMILNPLSRDLNGMRQTLLFGGLEAVAMNTNYKNGDLRLYEFGNCYSFYNEKEGDNTLVKYSEGQQLAFFLSGKKEATGWNVSDESSNFYELKQYVEKTLKSVNYDISSLKVKETETDTFAYGLTYGVKKNVLVKFGSVSKKILQQFDIDFEVFYAEFDWDKVIKFMPPVRKYVEIAKFPAVQRDLALLLDKKVKFSEIENIAFQAERKLLKEVSIFDVYEGKNLPEGKKSYAVRYIIQDETKTLKDKQIDKIMNKLMASYKKQLNAEIR